MRSGWGRATGGVRWAAGAVPPTAGAVPPTAGATRFAAFAGAAVLCALALGPAHAHSGSRTWLVCPTNLKARGCDFKGDKALQQAVDRAANGDVIQLRAGVYVPLTFRDVPFQDVKVRGYVVIEGKDLSIAGEPGVVIDGTAGLPSSAFVIHLASVTMHDLEIANFRYAVEEDDIYDGHGIFAIDSRLKIDNVTIRKTAKMALTGRGATTLEVAKLNLLDGHVGIWLHETAYLRLSDCTIRNNGLSGIAAYDDSVVHVSNCVLEANEHDALFTQHRATIYSKGSSLLNNKRFGAQASGASRIWIDSATMSGNGADTGTKDHGEVRVADPANRGSPPTSP